MFLRIPSRVAIPLLTAFLLLAPGTAAFGAAPAPIGSAMGTCDDTFYTNFEAPPVGASHPDTVARLTTNATDGGEWDAGESPGDPNRFEGPDVIWAPSRPLAAGDSPRGFLICSGGPAEFTADFFDTPTVPTSFSGLTSVGSQGSLLRVLIPAQAQYVTDVSLTSGAISLEDFFPLVRPPISAATGGTYPLGTVDKGFLEFGVRASGIGQAGWTVGLRALPVELSAVEFSHPRTRAGRRNALNFTVSGEATVTARVLKAGKTVRVLSEHQKLKERGDYFVLFDGRRATGGKLSPGKYRGEVSIVDYFGNSARFSAPLRIKRRH